MLIAFSLLTVLWIWTSWRGARAVAAIPPLPAAVPTTPPAVTAVIATRDDAASIAEAVDRLLSQQGVDLRLIVVDDRSVDATPSLLAARAACEPRLQVERVDVLPSGWLGKSHALQVGAAAVTTPWLLFLDGDVWLVPDAIARAVAAAEATAADHAVLLPTHRNTTFLGKACLLAFHLSIARRVAAVNAPRQRTWVGAGAFNLVRTGAYRAVGGHQPLRLEVVDDVGLGLLLFRAGFRSRVWVAARDLAIDWGGTPMRLLRVVEKNMFAVLGYRTWLAAVLLGLSAALLGGTFAGPWLAGAPGVAAVAAYASTAFATVALARQQGWPVAAGWLGPLAAMWLPIALARSVAVTLVRRGVRWRGTFYSLAELRRGRLR
ncbi:MAG: glycosyltransferase [Planctomycetes bacterium]|nr:glycosyltransferase [Planctomycetota bacterium]